MKTALLIFGLVAVVGFAAVAIVGILQIKGHIRMPKAAREDERFSKDEEN